jgi:streptomycin 6-kinase
MIAIPDAFARGTIGREGPAGASWIAELPGIVGDLLGRWECVPDGQALHGAVGIIVPVRRRAAEPAVLKVSCPHPGNVHEPDAFAAWAGRGAVRLLERDDLRYAMLLERAGTSTLAELPDGNQAAAIAGRISRRLAIPAPPGLPRLCEDAPRWELELRQDAARLPGLLPKYAVDAAIATAGELGRDQPDLVVHGDFHARNILRAEREPWLIIDPKGYAGDPAYDAGMPVKWRPFRSLTGDDLRKAVRQALDIFADAAGLSRERVRRWAHFHAVRASFWDRLHETEVATDATGRGRVAEFADQLAELLAQPS